MARFHDLVGQMREPGEDGLPESIYDDLTTEYDTMFDGSQATLAERDSMIGELNDQITRLKTANYDLLVTQSGNGGNTELYTEVSDDAEPTIESLFERKDA